MTMSSVIMCYVIVLIFYHTCLTVFVTCWVKQFAICLGVVVILFLNVMEVFSGGGGALLAIPFMLFQRMCV